MCLGARLGLQARASTLDEYLRAKGGWDYIRPGALRAEVNDVSLGRRKLYNIRQYCNDTTHVDSPLSGWGGKVESLGERTDEGHELESGPGYHILYRHLSPRVVD